MKDIFRQSMAWLHTWAGLLLGWLLFVIFAAGSSAYFQEEITRWMQPEVPFTRADPATAAQGAVEYLTRKVPDATSWYIELPGPRRATSSLFWQLPEGASGETTATLDGAGHPVKARATAGGFFLYRLHFDLHYVPVIWARYLVGIAAMAMLLAILSGVVTHKKIFVDFFLLRFGKGQRSWLDAHNVTAVLALPFYLMITFTGLVTLATLYMPWAIAANYTSQDRFFEVAFPRAADTPRSGQHAALAPIGPMVAQAQSLWGKPPGFVEISNPGDATANVLLTGTPSAQINARPPTLRFGGTDGVRHGASPVPGPARQTEGVMIGLHAGRFAGIGLRWLYFLSALGGTAMVGTGLILWVAKRRQKLPNPMRPHFGFRLVERLNIATVAGFPLALAGYFLANRLLPVTLADRPAAEINALFVTWGAAALWSFIRPARRAWYEVLAVCSASYLAIPIVNAATTDRGLVRSLTNGDMGFAAFDLVMIAFAIGWGFAAWKAGHPRTAPLRNRKVRVPGATKALVE